MDLKLRPYQEEIIASIFDAKMRGVMRPLVVLPTGAGKTASAIAFARAYYKQFPGRILWLTHRDELVQQTVRSTELWWPDHPAIGIVKAERNDVEYPFVVASVQTLGSERRRAQLILHGGFSLVISDEHHYSVAPVWSSVLKGLGCGEPGGPLQLGLTATPNRTDKVGLKATADEIVYEKDILWGIANSFLVRPRGMTVDIDLSGVKVSRGDYQLGSLGDALEFENAHAIVARLIQEYAPERKTIVYTPTVNFARLVTEECRKLGFKAEMVSGETALDVRHEIYARLRTKKTQIVVNCNVLVEGFDEPSVDCIVMARPTQSQTLFTQAVGRGLRPFPGKEDCLVLALAGTERHKLVTLASLAGREYETEAKGKERTEAGFFDLFGTVQNIVKKRQAFKESLVTKSREIDLLRPDIRKDIAWATISNSVFAKRLIPGEHEKRGRVLIWKQTDSVKDEWKVCEGIENPYTYQFKYNTLLTGVDFATAQSFANDLLKENMPHDSFINPNASWRSQPASEKQIEYLRKMKIIFSDNITKGQASELMDVRILKKAAQNA